LQPFVIDNVNWDKLEKLSEELKMSILNDLTREETETQIIKGFLK